VLPYARSVNTVEALQLALELADMADAITMERFRADDLVVTTKPDLTPVSEADQAVERALRTRLAQETTHLVLGEEYGTEGSDPAELPVGSSHSKYRWIIDPIDGTKSYVRGVPIWATLIGLERSGEMIVGVASAPALGMRWWAGKGLGAFRDGARLAVSSVASLDDAQVTFAWDTSERFHADGIGPKLVELSHKCWRTRGIGDFWQHLLVAEGAFDVAIDPIVSLWDIAALIPIINESGGRWSTVDGRSDANGDSFVCTNGLLHDAVIASLA
jgi:histidinol-phosphatase